MEVENEVTVGVQTSLVITDENSVPIDTFKPDILCLEAIRSINLLIERHTQSSDACGQRYYSATDDINEPVTKKKLSKEYLQAAEIKSERSG